MSQHKQQGIDDMTPNEEGGSGQIYGKMEEDTGTGGSKGSEHGITGGNPSGYGKDEGDPTANSPVDKKGARDEEGSTSGVGAGAVTGDDSQTRNTGGMTGGAGSSSNQGGAGGSGSGGTGGGGGA